MKHITFFLTMILAVCTIQAQDITLSFQNPEVTTEGPDSFYEVDVMIASDVAFSMGSGQFFLDYSATAFGTQVANNNRITFERPDTSLLGGEVVVDVGGTPVPLGAYYTSFINNDTEDTKVSFIWQQNASSGMYGDNVPAGTPVALVHLKIRFLPGATGEDPAVCFDATNPFDDQFFTACGPFNPLVGFNFEGANCQGEPGSQIFDYTPDCNLPGPFEVACQDSTVQLDGNGSVTITPETIFNGDPNDPSIDTLTLDIDSFNCSNIGENTVTLTATNVDGSTATCTAIVTVEDTLVPEALCQDITIQLDTDGNASIVASDVDGGSTDNCDIASLTISQDTFTSADIGENTVTLTVTDDSGNTDTCTATVTVVDQIFTEAVCQNITVQLDANGNATITPEQVDGGSTNVDTLSLDITSFDCSNIGENMVTLTVTGVDDTSDSCTAIVTVEDTLAPEALCQDVTVQLDINGNASVTATDIDGGSTDNCDGAVSLTLGAFQTTGSIDENDIVDDLFGNATPELVDAFEFTIPVEGTYRIESTGFISGNGGAVAVIYSEQPVRNSGPASERPGFIDAHLFNSDGSVFAEGIFNLTPGTYFLDVFSGNPNIDATIEVYEIAVVLDSETATFTDNELGENNISLLAIDEAGNRSNCEATVTIVDQIFAEAVCQNIIVQLDVNGNATITPEQVDGGSTNGDSLTLDITSFDCSNIGENTVTLTVTSVDDNSDSCTAIVTVEDTLAPEALCQNITVQLDANGNANITATDIDNGSTDNCGIASLSIDTTSFNCSNIGENTVTLTVTDTSGNMTSCEATVLVEDTVAPEVICQAFTVQLDATGIATITAADIDGGSTDNCGIASLSIDVDSFDCTNVGENTVQLTIVDTNGNEASCTTTVTVEDTVAPEVICQDITVQLDATGIATITAESINNGASDNCAIETLSIDIDTFTCADLGENTVTLAVIDTNGNEASCTAVVTVEDLITPTAICQDITLQLDENGEAAFDITQIDGGSADNCDFTIDLGTLLYAGEISDTDIEDTFIVGDNPSFLDAYSFVAPFTGTYQLTHTTTGDLGALAILYDAPPVRNSGNLLTRPEFVGFTFRSPEGVFINGTLNFELEQGTTYFVDVSTSQSGQVIPSYDGYVRFVSSSNLSCGNIGVTEFSLIVSDLSGNIDMCTAIVTVEDLISPELVCPEDQTIELTDDMPLFELPDYFATGDATASDNCEDPVFTQDPVPGTLLDEGVHTITLCATDASGNESCCTFEVTVEDVLSIEDAVSLKDLKMYPNPASTMVYIANPSGISIETIAIYDLRGRLVATHDRHTAIGTVSFDVTTLAKGAYFVEIQGTLGSIRKQLIKR